MKLLLLKTLLRRKASDDGYVLPMAIAIGLVMVLLGAVNLTSANEEKLNAITKNSRSDALGIAEVGVAKYREMLDRNRILTVYNRAQWTSNNVNGIDVASQTCDVIDAATNGWASNEPPGTAFNAANWRAVTLDETVVNIDLNEDGDALDNAVNIGWFKIVDYEYDIDGTLGGTDNDGVIDATDDNGVFSVVSDANTDDDPSEPGDPPPPLPVGSITDENDTDDDSRSDARGILTVKGRTPDGSEAQIQVDIPIRINDLNNLAPVLWIGGNAITAPGNPGNLNFPNANENIILTNAGAGCAAPPAIAGNTNVLNDPRGIPPIIDLSSIPVGNRNPLGAPFPSLLPRPGLADTKTSNDDDGRFLYEITTPLNLNNSNLLTDGVSKVTLHVDADINITNGAGTVTIGNENASTLANFNAANSNVSSHNLEIYVAQGNPLAPNSITIDTTGGGTVNIEALIHAPDATLTITGNGTVNINGALWVNDINNSAGATLNIRGDQTDTATVSEPSYKFYTSSANRTPRPLTGSPTNWKTEEVN